MTEIPMVDKGSIEPMADNLPVGDCETIAERLCDEIRAARVHCRLPGAYG